jgi:hypothetical protein
MKKVLGIVLLLFIGGFVVYYFANRNTSSTSNNSPEIPTIETQVTEKPTITSTVPIGTDPWNTTYIIEGQQVTLIDGKSSVPAAPGSATMITTEVFGNEAVGDLNGDGTLDTAFLLTQTSGGSGTFFYMVASLQNKDKTYTGTNGILLGDRIAPQATQIEDMTIIANYATRPEGAPMTEKPSVMTSKWMQVEGTTLYEIPQPTK